MAVSGEAVFVVNLDWAIVYASSAAAKLFRRTHSALLQSSIFSLMPLRIREGQTTLWKSVPPGGECLRVDTLGLRDKEEFPLKVELARIPDHPLLCVTLRTPAASEKQNRQSQKMEALGLLAGGVAHDFNNALTAIIGFTESVQEELVANPQLSDDLQEVLNAARDAGELTKQLLSFARRRPVESAIVELNTAVGEIEKLLRRTLPAAIDIRIIPSPTEINVRIAPTELHQILINLATNAHHAMPSGGTLQIELISALGGDMASAEEEFATVKVTDTGIGISEDDIGKVFDPFFSTKGEEGTGLGLSTCFGIATQAGGSLTVSSTPGAGTCFALCLPTSRTLPVRLLTTTQRVDIRRHKGLALVVEDQSAIRKYMARVVGGSGLEVHAASSAEEALQIFASLEAPLDLLLTDSMLPGMSGQDLARTLQKSVENLRVVLTSGHVNPSSDQSILTGNMAFLAKPFTAIQLRRAVDNLLNPPRKLIGKILVIGPSEQTASEARALLRDVGHEITILSSADEALQHLQDSQEKPSLLLLDAGTPGLSATELFASPQIAPHARELPLILLTDSAASTVALPPRINASRLCKPLTRDNLSAALAKVGLELT